MHLARRIPVLRDNPMFVLEATRVWRPRLVSIFAIAAIAISLVSLAGGAVSMRYLRAGTVTSQLAAWGTSLASRVLPSTLAGFDEAGYGEGFLRGGTGGPLTRALVWLTFFALMFAGYVLPGIMAGSISKERENHTFDGLAIADLPPATVLLGKFAATAGPLFLAALLLAIAAPLIPGESGLLADAADRLVLVVMTTGIICLGVSSLCRRTLTAVVACYAIVLGIDWVLGTVAEHGFSTWLYSYSWTDYAPWAAVAAPGTRGVLAVAGWLVAVRQVRKMMRGQ
jgi:hypothetical protein